MDWEVHSEAFNKTESKRFDSRLRVYRWRLSIPRRGRIMATRTSGGIRAGSYGFASQYRTVCLNKETKSVVG